MRQWLFSALVAVCVAVGTWGWNDTRERIAQLDRDGSRRGQVELAKLKADSEHQGKQLDRIEEKIDALAEGRSFRPRRRDDDPRDGR